MQWTLKREFRFEASHQLLDHDGKCARLHGHSWVLTIEVTGKTLLQTNAKRNMILDYGDLKAIVQPLVDKLDHYHLNDIVQTRMPTSEAIAWWVYKKLAEQFPKNVNLSAVRIGETCQTECEYRP